MFGQRKKSSSESMADRRIKLAIADVLEKLYDAVSGETGGTCFINFSMTIAPNKNPDADESWQDSLRDD